MADAENNLQPSKKRTAGVQLTRENNGLDEDEDTSEQETGTFRKASDEVLATRRFVKVRRQQTSSTTSAPAPTSASNPFAGILLMPSASSTTPVESEASKVTGKEPEQVNNDDGKVEDKVDEAKVESAAEEKIDANDGQSGNENTAPSTEKNESNERNTTETETDVSDEKKESEPVTVEVVKGQSSEDGAQKATEADDARGVKDSEGGGDDKEKNRAETIEKGGETVSVSSFGQLSSTQNAFSGLSGAGFSSTPFSFGSIPKDGSGSATSSLFGLKSDQPTFGFGASNNGNSSIFGTSGSTIFTKNENSKAPPMQEVPVETGEENEDTVFTADSILFEFVDGSWKERGKGELKVNVPSTGTGQSRLVMRTKGNLRLILNSNLFPDMKLTGMDKRGISFACVNSASEGKDGLSTIALKFRDASIVEDFRAAVMKYKDKTSGTLKTPESSPNASEV